MLVQCGSRIEPGRPVSGACKIFWSIEERREMFGRKTWEVDVNSLTIGRVVTASICVHICGRDELGG